MRYFIKIAYDGSKFYGFQRLPNVLTVQRSLEEALSIIDRNPVEVKGAGRTDRGVHAAGQGVHFDLIHDIPAEGLQKVLNQMVSPYIHVLLCRTVSNDFHARFSVFQKTYRYRIYFGGYDPCLYDYVYECPYDLNLNLMKQASDLFLGVHDFRHFVSGERDHYEAIIYRIDFIKDGDFLDIVFVGKSFYRYMVRNLVGALIDVGRGKRCISDVEKSLEDVEYFKQFSTAISNGLYLEDVSYEGAIL